MQEQEFFQKSLSRKFMERRSRNPEYSLRAIARDLNQNPAALSQILRGTRRVS